MRSWRCRQCRIVLQMSEWQSAGIADEVDRDARDSSSAAKMAGKGRAGPCLVERKEGFDRCAERCLC